MLSAKDEGARQSPAQEAAVGGSEMNDYDRESEEVQEANRHEIGLVDRPKQLQQNGRERIMDAVDGPAQIDDQGSEHEGDGRSKNPPTGHRNRTPGGAGKTARCTNDEEKLPGKRIEEPDLVLRIAVH